MAIRPVSTQLLTTRLISPSKKSEADVAGEDLAAAAFKIFGSKLGLETSSESTLPLNHARRHKFSGFVSNFVYKS